MPLTNRVRPRIGDVIEISTPRGFAYAHFTHNLVEPPHWGALIRVLPGLFATRPADFSDLVLQRPVFSTFFPLGAACNRRIVCIVANELIAAHSQAFPIFKSRNHGRNGSVGPWWLWDGEKTWRPETLSTAQLRDYPLKEIVNDTMLVSRIVSGWRHDTDA